MELTVHSDYIIEHWFGLYRVNIGINGVGIAKRDEEYIAYPRIFKRAVVFTTQPPQMIDSSGRRSSEMTHPNRELTRELQSLSEDEWTVTEGGNTWLEITLATPHGPFAAQLKITSEGGVPEELFKHCRRLFQERLDRNSDPMS